MSPGAAWRRSAVVVLLSIVTVGAHGRATQTQTQTQRAETPAWFTGLLADLVADGDEWVADNAPYRSGQEPVDAYVMTWAWGPGRHSVSGRLHPVVGGVQRPALWEFRQFWHPDRREARLVQYGTDGTVGDGALRRSNDGSIVAEQDFWSPSGQSWRQRHVERAEARSRESRDARWGDGAWRDGRRYVWTRRAAGARGR
jgi:hypothetical protein